MWQIASVIAVLCLSACATWPSPSLRTTVKASSSINQYSNSKGLPVGLIFYQLADIKKFKAASFNELWRNDKAVLGDELIEKSQYIISPNETKELSFKLRKKAQYLGVVALFRQSKNKKWRTYQELPSLITTVFYRKNLLLKKNKVVFI
jgi:type VI secretion system protein VasD